MGLMGAIGPISPLAYYAQTRKAQWAYETSLILLLVDVYRGLAYLACEKEW